MFESPWLKWLPRFFPKPPPPYSRECVPGRNLIDITIVVKLHESQIYDNSMSKGLGQTRAKSGWPGQLGLEWNSTNPLKLPWRITNSARADVSCHLSFSFGCLKYPQVWSGAEERIPGFVVAKAQCIDWGIFFNYVLQTVPQKNFLKFDSFSEFA